MPDRLPASPAVLGPRAPAAPVTAARLSLGNPSPAVSTTDHLRFQLDNALARDAVHLALDVNLLSEGLRSRGLAPVLLQSAAADRTTYLRRPDFGRTLSAASVQTLERHVPDQPPAIALLLADGLSALALERNALPLLDALLPLLPHYLPLTPVVTNARVAIGDPIGHILTAQASVLLIGERPGLSSPDSLGCYITWCPRPGRTDAERNCISNIRGDAGLSYAEAAHRIAYYLHEAQRLGTTGITLKDPDPQALLTPPAAV